MRASVSLFVHLCLLLSPYFLSLIVISELSSLEFGLANCVGIF